MYARVDAALHRIRETSAVNILPWNPEPLLLLHTHLLKCLLQTVQAFAAEHLKTPLGEPVKGKKNKSSTDLWLEKFYKKKTNLPEPFPHELVERLEKYLDVSILYFRYKYYNHHKTTYLYNILSFPEPRGAARRPVFATIRPPAARCKHEQLRDTAKLNVHTAVCVPYLFLFMIFACKLDSTRFTCKFAGTWIMFWRVRGRRWSAVPSSISCRRTTLRTIYMQGFFLLAFSFILPLFSLHLQFADFMTLHLQSHVN